MTTNILMPYGGCDTYNNGGYSDIVFGPIGRSGNTHAFYDPNDLTWKLLPVTTFVTNVNNCRVNGIPNQSLPVGSFGAPGAAAPTHIVTTGIDENGIMFIDLIAIANGAIIDPETGIKCMLLNGVNSHQPMVGMVWRHPIFGTQGQVGSEYLIGRNQMWAIGLETTPAFPPPNYNFPCDSNWHPVGDPIELCAWSDRMPTECSANLIFFCNTVGTSLSACIRVNGGEIGAHVGAETCHGANSPINVYIPFCFNGARSDGFYSLQLMARSNAPTGPATISQIGFAYNSKFKAGIAF